MTPSLVSTLPVSRTYGSSMASLQWQLAPGRAGGVVRHVAVLDPRLGLLAIPERADAQHQVRISPDGVPAGAGQVAGLVERHVLAVLGAGEDQRGVAPAALGWLL